MKWWALCTSIACTGIALGKVQYDIESHEVSVNATAWNNTLRGLAKHVRHSKVESAKATHTFHSVMVSSAAAGAGLLGLTALGNVAGTMGSSDSSGSSRSWLECPIDLDEDPQDQCTDVPLNAQPCYCANNEEYQCKYDFASRPGGSSLRTEEPAAAPGGWSCRWEDNAKQCNYCSIAPGFSTQCGGWGHGSSLGYPKVNNEVARSVARAQSVAGGGDFLSLANVELDDCMVKALRLWIPTAATITFNEVAISQPALDLFLYDFGSIQSSADDIEFGVDGNPDSHGFTYLTESIGNEPRLAVITLNNLPRLDCIAQSIGKKLTKFVNLAASGIAGMDDAKLKVLPSSLLEYVSVAPGSIQFTQFRMSYNPVCETLRGNSDFVTGVNPQCIGNSMKDCSCYFEFGDTFTIKDALEYLASKGKLSDKKCNQD